ncbi:MAG TPA: ABC transporter substrate-binding protein [Candidatus Scatomorpha intestinavium]|uniref:ABC transporter substrate-binding protein n=1 Tax=Candidatus Scatomorpha intestinavium TaxID=2840922 RepID=A0A9D0ZF27_9FIRM|nr:ABC transporter substrate-binding protein [Candidatus Scatomorpha intestinavium]
MKKKFSAALLAAAMLLSLTACGSGGETQSPAGTGEPSASAEAEFTPAEYAIGQITIGTTAAIESAVRDEYDYDMLASAVSEPPLVYQDLDGEYHPLLASYETADSVTWTYTILDGMTWSDGEPVTAADILFTLRYEDEHGGANFVSQTDDEGEVTEAKYTGYTLSDDGMSISLTLSAANVRELSNMATFRVMPEHIYAGNSSVAEAEARVSCGPYVLEDFNREAGTLTFAVNPYYPGTPNVERIVYRLFSNDDTMYMALLSGDIDMVWNYSAGVPAAYQDVLAGSGDVTLVSVAASNAPAVLAFNNARGPFTDENLRLAVSYALDYDAFRTYFGSEYAEIPNRGFVPPTTVGYKDTEPLATDHDTAAEYMAAAGYSDKNADGFYINSAGEEAAFTLTVNAGRETHVGIAELVKTNLEEFGIRVTLDAVDSDTYNAKTSNRFSENNITMEAAIYGYTSAGMGMMNGLATIYVDGNHAVQGGCQVFDAAFQDILSALSASETLEEYYAAAGEVQDYYAGHAPLIALYWDSLIYAHSSRFENVTVDALFGLNNMNNWFTITEKQA